MTELLDRAVEATRTFPGETQDDIARIVLQFAGENEGKPVTLSPAERLAIDASKAAAERGEFASDAHVWLAWAKRGL